jgi:hypothetical protein
MASLRDKAYDDLMLQGGVPRYAWWPVWDLDGSVMRPKFCINAVTRNLEDCDLQKKIDHDGSFNSDDEYSTVFFTHSLSNQN